jgi:hypothetical protein
VVGVGGVVGGVVEGAAEGEEGACGECERFAERVADAPARVVAGDGEECASVAARGRGFEEELAAAGAHGGVEGEEYGGGVESGGGDDLGGSGIGGESEWGAATTSERVALVGGWAAVVNFRAMRSWPETILPIGAA